METKDKLGYIAFYKTERHELYADSLYDAKKKAIEHFKPKKSMAHMVHVALAEKNGQVVVHVATE